MSTSYNTGTHDYDLNYAALAVSIIKKLPAEKSFNLLFGKTSHTSWQEKDVLQMIEERNSGVTFAKIGVMFGTSATVIYRQIYNYRKKHVLD